ncbi:LysR family transcriptional regulator [Lysobacter gummosus]|nr:MULTISPECIES: LysR family transcriptional regulator [Lysobacter]UJB18033.1 LysR family transcriptional regulator [Lysobacter capsici]UJQ28244.1 LysR family transcriptional regulator [Lysobacter gummosus]
MLDINAVAVFVQTVKTGSFAAAGRRLGQPANTVSRRVQQLEEQLGTRLLQRSTRKLSLTGAGREFFDRCVAGIEDIESAQAAISEGNGEPRGIVRAAVVADFFEFFPLERIEQLLSRYPELKLEFVLSDAHIDLIEQSIDVAFRAGDLADSSLVARRLSDSQSHVLLASPMYLRKHGSPATIAELAEHDCLIAPAAQGRANWRLDGPEGAVEVRVGGRFAANTLLSQVRAVRAGLGIGLLPHALIAEDLRAQGLVHVLPQYSRRSGGMFAVYPTRRQVPRAVAALIEVVESALDEMLAGPRDGESACIALETPLRRLV